MLLTMWRLEDDTCDVISNMYVQRCKCGGIMDKFGGMSKQKLNTMESLEFVFFQVCTQDIRIDHELANKDGPLEQDNILISLSFFCAFEGIFFSPAFNVCYT